MSTEPATSKRPALDALRTIGVRLLLFACILIGSQILYYHLFGGEDENLVRRGSGGFGGQHLSFATLSAIVENSPPVIFIGDSTAMRLPGDRSPGIGTTAWALDKELPECEIGSVVYGGFGPDAFARFVDYFEAEGVAPEYIVVTVNIRTFSAGWFFDDGGQHMGLRLGLKLAPLHAEPFHVPMTQFRLHEYLDRRTNPEYRRDGPAWNVARDHAAGLASSYGFTITEANPQLDALRDMNAAAERMGSKLVAYFTPADMDYLRNTFGADVARVTEQNIDQLVAICAREGITLLDLRGLIRPEEFLIKGTTASHLHGIGRQRIARAIASWLCENASEASQSQFCTGPAPNYHLTPLHSSAPPDQSDTPTDEF